MKHKRFHKSGLIVLVAVTVLAAAAIIYVSWPKSKVTVQMTDGGFEPAQVKVKQGGVVIWRNASSVDYMISGGHEHTRANHSSWGSHATIKPGQNFYEVFEAAGTYPYHDRLHPDRRGTVVVVP